MPALKHIHTYERSKLNNRTYRCADPECSHYSRKELIEGKQAQCKFCGAIFILTAYDLTLKNPRCKRCSNLKRNKLENKAVDIMDEILSNLPTEVTNEIDTITD